MPLASNHLAWQRRTLTRARGRAWTMPRANVVQCACQWCMLCCAAWLQIGGEIDKQSFEMEDNVHTANFMVRLFSGEIQPGARWARAAHDARGLQEHLPGDGCGSFVMHGGIAHLLAVGSTLPGGCHTRLLDPGLRSYWRGSPPGCPCNAALCFLLCVAGSIVPRAPYLWPACLPTETDPPD